MRQSMFRCDSYEAVKELKEKMFVAVIVLYAVVASVVLFMFPYFRSLSIGAAN